MATAPADAKPEFSTPTTTPQAGGKENGAKPADQKARRASPANKESKWPILADEPLLFRVPVIGGTGPYSSGKTVFGLTLAPGMHPAGHPYAGQPRTLVIDMEMSSISYTGMPILHVDGPAEIRRWNSSKGKVAEPSELDKFIWFHDFIVQHAQIGQYDVIMVDPANDLESGLARYVYENAGKFGATQNQFNKMNAIYQAVINQYWKTIQLDIASRCRAFYFTTHERVKYVNNQPTKEKEARGRTTFFELSSLYLRFERQPGKAGERPQPPSADILKQRMSHSFLDDSGELQFVRILPDRLPEATVKAIKHYVRFPVGDRKLKEDEQQVVREMTDEDRRLVELEIAQANRDAEQAKLSTMELARQAAERQAQVTAVAALTGALPVTGAPQASATVGPTASSSGGIRGKTDPTTLPISESLADHLRGVLRRAYADIAEVSPLLASVGVTSVAQLNYDQYQRVLGAAELRILDNESREVFGDGASAPVAREPEPPTSTTPAPDNDLSYPECAATECATPIGATRTQALQLEALCRRLTMPGDQQIAMLKRRGAEMFSDLSWSAAEDLIAKLSEMESPPKN